MKQNDEISHKMYPPVSKITFDEKTGTITLKLASEEEIALNEEIKKQRAINNEQRASSN